MNISSVRVYVRILRVRYIIRLYQRFSTGVPREGIWGSAKKKA